MARMKLGLDTLRDFDVGKAHVAFAEALETAVKDCLDRSGEKKARIVTLTTNIVPVILQDGDVVDAEVDFKITAKLPAWTTHPRRTLIDRQGRLFFNPDSPDDPRQRTIDEVGQEAETDGE